MSDNRPLRAYMARYRIAGYQMALIYARDGAEAREKFDRREIEWEEGEGDMFPTSRPTIRREPASDPE